MSNSLAFRQEPCGGKFRPRRSLARVGSIDGGTEQNKVKLQRDHNDFIGLHVVKKQCHPYKKMPHSLLWVDFVLWNYI